MSLTNAVPSVRCQSETHLLYDSICRVDEFIDGRQMRHFRVGLCKNGEQQLVSTSDSQHVDSTLGFNCGHVCTGAYRETHHTL